MVQPGNPDYGVEVGHLGAADAEAVERLRAIRAGVTQLVEQRAREGIELVGIDIAVKFLDSRPPNECACGYSFMYDVVESETEKCPE
jgi:hypothetical protein